MTKELKQEFTLKISQANKTGLIVILYEMVLAFLEEAQEAFDAKERTGFKKGVQRAEDCLDELIASLDLQYEIGRRLHSLYFFYKRELARARVQEEKKLLVPVIKMIRELKQAYEEVAKQDNSAPLMENSQAVYAGLTYGRSCLNVDLADQSTNRGFLV